MWEVNLFWPAVFGLVLAFALLSVLGFFYDRSCQKHERLVNELNRKTCRYCGRKEGRFTTECHFCGAPIPPNPVIYH